MRMLRNKSSRKNLKSFFVNFVDSLPLAVPVALGVFACVGVLLLLLGLLNGPLIWIIGIPGALVAWLVTAKYDISVEKPGASKDKRLVNILMLLFIVGWVGFNVRYTSQHLITERDPGVYTTASIWVAQGSNLEISPSNVFDNSNGVRSYSGGYAPNNDKPPALNAQGAHTLPVLIGLSGRIVGSEHMLRLTVLFGAMALLAMYSLVRLMVKPAWAFVAVATLSASLPLIYFSRDTYTEPLLATFTLSALALLWSAQSSQRLGLWFLAGILSGAGVLVRIDAFMSVAAVLAGAIIYLCLASPAERNKRSAQVATLISGTTLVALIGWLDVSNLSVSYYRNQWPNYIKPQVELIGLILLCGVLAVAVSWRTNALQRLDRLTNHWRGHAVALTTLVVLGIIASRPFWYTTYATRKIVDESGRYAQSEPFRAYIEGTFNWIIWYVGPVMAICGVIGLAIMGYRATQRRGLLFVTPFLVFVGTTCFYLIRPAIFPDQIWAARRFLPVIFPAMCIAGVIALEHLYGLRRRKILGLDGKTVATVLATLAVVGPLFVSQPFLFTREATWYAPVSAVCEVTSQNDAILWVGSAGTQLLEATKSVCGVNAQGYGRTFNTDPPDNDVLKKISEDAQKQGRSALVGVYASEVDKVLPDRVQQMTVVSTFSFAQLEKPFNRPPINTTRTTESILLARVTERGDLVPLGVTVY
jgi:4-amino-4-deoxy-L-arabinose transferase-like glycosyltransferase